VPYPEQVEGKAASFRGLLQSRLGLGSEHFRPPLRSPEEWGYRNRVGLKVRLRGRDIALGYFAARSHRVVSVQACPIARPEIQELLGPLRALLQGFGPALAGRLPQVDLQVDGNRRVWAVFHLLEQLDRRSNGALLAFARDRGLGGAFVQTGRKQTLSPLGDREPGSTTFPFRLEAVGRSLALEVSPGGFVQANWAVNQALVDELAGLAPLFQGQAALDLFCGAGNFTLPLALTASSVVGIEGYPPAAADAEGNARRNGLGNVRILARPAAEGLHVLAGEGFRPGFALLDPPREGAADVLTSLAALEPPHLLYVSCSPSTLVRDLGILAGLGYRVEWTRMADMFPQTAHAESLTLLRRL
jgi:23S rRNA (uracil1939-C5)-methyltransferase